jgi:hypothetical protein
LLLNSPDGTRRGVRIVFRGVSDDPGPPLAETARMTRASASALTPPWGRAVVAIRLLVRAVVATLALFHGWLFASQAALRWIVAGGLVTALSVLWRRGESLSGRKAVAVWVLAALLHGPALADRQIHADDQAPLPGAVASVLLLAGPAAGLTILLLAALTRRHRPFVPTFIPVSRHEVWLRPSGVVAGWSCAPRPPPCV